ncbi:MAG: hypothetical protein M1479_05700 [Actinobacteria bacterium]|nr:hypothetical protein [Cyanobacteriota bacterium]MCL5771747.1 hypothetical protein [Actinomycetota bacterium]
MIFLIFRLTEIIGLTIGILLGLLVLLLRSIPFFGTFMSIFIVVIFSFACIILFLRDNRLKIYILRLNKRVKDIKDILQTSTRRKIFSKTVTSGE